MNLFISLILASLVPIATNPTSMTYLALATVHMIIVRCYLVHTDGRALALCAALTAILYVGLALIHLVH